MSNDKAYWRTLETSFHPENSDICNTPLLCNEDNNVDPQQSLKLDSPALRSLCENNQQPAIPWIRFLSLKIPPYPSYFDA